MGASEFVLWLTFARFRVGRGQYGLQLCANRAGWPMQAFSREHNKKRFLKSINDRVKIWVESVTK